MPGSTQGPTIFSINHAFSGPCSKIERTVHSTSWSKDGIISKLIPDLEPGFNKLAFVYEGSNVEHTKLVGRVDFNTFIGGVGGSLGLFLGFSAIDTLYHIYNFAYICLFN